MMRDDFLKQKILEAAEKDTPNLSHQLFTKVESKLKDKRSKVWSLKPIWRLSYGVGALLIVLLLMWRNPFATPVPLTAVYLEFNPSMVIYLDEDDHFDSIEGLNADGVIFAELVLSQLLNQRLPNILNIVIDEAVEKGYLSVDAPVILYDVVNPNIRQSNHVLSVLELELPAAVNRHSQDALMHRGMAGNPSSLEEVIARNYGVSVMRLRLIEGIMAEDDTYTLEDLIERSMPELLELSQNFPPSGVPNHRGPR